MTNPIDAAIEDKTPVPEPPVEDLSNEANGKGVEMQALLTKEEVVSLIDEKKEKDKEQAKAEAAAKIKALLPKDAFSFLVFGSRPAFSIALACFVVQIFTLAIVAYDQFYSGNNDDANILGVPAFITWTVRLSQFLAIMFSVMMQMDVLWSINVLYKGYNEQAFREALKDDPLEHKYLKYWWGISAAARLGVGLFSLAVMFMLIMRSETGRSVLLSFNAVSFIGGLDNAVFVLSTWGYFGSTVQATSKSPIIGDIDLSKVASKFQVSLTNSLPLPSPSTANSKDQESPSKPNRKIHCTNLKRWRTITVTLIWLILEAFWLWITLKSINGDYLPTAVYVQFGDDEQPGLGLLSGIYDCKVSMNDVRYVARDTKIMPFNDHKEFRYCGAGKFWSLKTYFKEESDAFEEDVCKEWILKSSTTGGNQYDILGVADKNWKTKAPEGRKGDINLQTLIMKERSQPECAVDLYGPLCEFDKNLTCDSLALEGQAFNTYLSWSIYGIDLDENNSTVTPFYAKVDLNREGEAYARYEKLGEALPILIHDRPVYYVYRADLMVIGRKWRIYEVIMCLGRRWARLIIGLEDGNTPHLELKKKVRLLEAKFKQRRGVATTFRYVTHLSEAFDMATLKDDGSPIGLAWYTTSQKEVFKPDKAVSGTLHCQCPVCPDRISSIEESYIANTSFFVDNRASALDGQNMTCEDVATSSISTSRGSYLCSSLQMASIFECGCPYTRPRNRPCPICEDGGMISMELLDYVPFPGGYYGDIPCGKYSWIMNARAEFNMNDNEDWCPAFQSTYGKACGCTTNPAPPCDVQCPNEKDEFKDQHIVQNYDLDPQVLNGYYCSESLGFLAIERKCSEERKSALAEICCLEK